MPFSVHRGRKGKTGKVMRRLKVMLCVSDDGETLQEAETCEFLFFQCIPLFTEVECGQISILLDQLRNQHTLSLNMGYGNDIVKHFLTALSHYKGFEVNFTNGQNTRTTKLFTNIILTQKVHEGEDRDRKRWKKGKREW